MRLDVLHANRYAKLDGATTAKLLCSADFAMNTRFVRYSSIDSDEPRRMRSSPVAGLVGRGTWRHPDAPNRFRISLQQPRENTLMMNPEVHFEYRAATPPGQDGSGSAPTHESDIPCKGSRDKERARILIIDDSPTVVAMLGKILAARGHEVMQIDLMIRLPEVLKKDPPDLIILDLEMPLLSGETVGRLIRRFETSRIPIILFSSAGVADLQDVASTIEADAWLQKSSPPGQLLTVVDRALARMGFRPTRSSDDH